MLRAGELAQLDAEFPNYRKFPADGAYGIGLWSKHELESGATIALGRLPAIEARVRGPSGSFTVIGVHLALMRKWRRRQLATIRDRLSDDEAARSVVMGDFNEWSGDSGLEPLAGIYHVVSPGMTFHSSRPRAALARSLRSHTCSVVHARSTVGGVPRRTGLGNVRDRSG